MNFLQHFGLPQKHIVIPKPQHAPSLLAQITRARVITGDGVLTAIQLDNELRFETYEISDVGADRMVTSELEAGHAAST